MTQQSLEDFLICMELVEEKGGSVAMEGWVCCHGRVGLLPWKGGSGAMEGRVSCQYWFQLVSAHITIVTLLVPCPIHITLI